MLNITEYKNAERVFYYFEEISKIPRGSGNCRGIADYLCEFAKGQGLEFYRDGADNVLIRKPAAAGYESHTGVILQGHTDMVAAKDAGCPIDMEKECIKIYRDGDFLKARGTTLGADNGVAVAYMLAILEDKSLPHPELEALFTSDEEIGLIGAEAFDKSRLLGRIFINLDSGEEGVYTVGCAGGVRTDAKFTLGEDKVGGGEGYRLTVGGLAGGHSGNEIHNGSGNAIKIGFEVLSATPGVKLICAEGGTADNVIPRDFSAEFITECDDISGAHAKIDEILKRLERTDPSAFIKLEGAAVSGRARSAEDSARAISAVCAYPVGVVKMSEDIEGLVETSLSEGIARLSGEEFTLCASVRSSKNAEKDKVVEALRSICEGHGGEFSTRGAYPGWAFSKNSLIRDIACKTYKDMTGKDASYYAVHAGLECGLFADEIEGLDCISMGPDMYDIHTTGERLSISSTASFYEFLTELIKRI